MIELSPVIKAEYERWISQILPEELSPASAHALGLQEVIQAHFLIADFFNETGEGIGGIGPRDINLLHSAVFRQHTGYGGKKKWKTNFEIAATLFFGLVKDHPFHDANKRTALLCLLFQLQKCNRVPTVSDKYLDRFTVEVAEGSLAKYSLYKELVKKGEEDPEVRFIAHALKKNTRNIDNRHYFVTYRDLNTILKKKGYELQNPHANTIDVVRVEERRKVFGVFGKKETLGVKVVQIGFPGWTKQVNQGAIKSIRASTRLDANNGVDSAAFFGDVDPVLQLIARYQEPLRALAYK